MMTTPAVTVHAELAAAHVAHAEWFRAIVSPYDLAARLESEWRGGPRASRIRAVMVFYSRFVELSAQWPDADRDALVAVGAGLFGVGRRTLRADLARAMAASPQSVARS